MNESNVPRCIASGEDETGVWLQFDNGTKRYVLYK